MGRPRQSRSLAEEASTAFFELLMKQRGWYESKADRLELSPIQARTVLLMSEGPATMSEVARAALCEPSNLTGIIDKLEARGLVERRAAAGDRRVKLVSLTAHGLATRKRFIASITEPPPWMLALSAREQRQLRDLFRKAISVMPEAKP